MSNLLTTLQAAAQLGLHPDTLRLWRGQGKGPRCFRIGCRYRYSQEALDEFLKNSEEAK